MRKGDKKRSPARNLGIRTAKGTLTYITGNVIGSLAVLLLIIILARLLNPPDFGLYAIAIAFYSILSGHFIFGVVLRKELPNMGDSKEKARELISSCFVVALLVALAVSIAAMLLGGPIAVYIYHDASLTGSLMLAGALVFFYSLFNLMLATLIAIGRVKEGTIIYLAYAFLQLVFSVGLVLMGYGIFGAIVGLGIGLAIPSLLGLYWIMKHLEGRLAMPTKKMMRHVVDFSSPVLASSLANQGPPNLAILLLGAFATTAIVGNYNAAFRLGNFVNVILLATSYVLLPAFSRAFSDKKLSANIGKIYNSSIYYTLLLLLPVLVFVVSVAHPLMYALFSDQYSLAPLFFALIAIGSTIGMLNTYAANLQLGYGDTKKFMYYQLIAIAIQVALLFVLTPLFGAIGTIFALFIISQIIINIIYIRVLYRQFSLKHSFAGVARLAVPAALLMVLLYLVTLLLHNSMWAILVNLIATIVFFPPLAALFGGVKENNLRFIKETAQSLKIGGIADYLIKYTGLFVRQ